MTNLLDDIASRHCHHGDTPTWFNPLTNHVEVAQFGQGFGQSFDQQWQSLFGQKPAAA